MDSSNIFIGIVTCERPTFLKNLVASVASMPNISVVSDSRADGSMLSQEMSALPPHAKYFKTTGRISVGQSKNIIINQFMKSKCEYLFIIEDDMLINDISVFDDYITAHKNTGIHHFMYALHCPENKDGREGRDKHRQPVKLEYDVVLYAEMCGSMCFYTRDAIQAAGLMDVAYYNAMEHVDHSYIIAQAGLTTPFRWFPDVRDAETKISEQATTDSSLLRKDQVWIDNVRHAIAHFNSKHGAINLKQRSINDLFDFVRKNFKK